MQCSIPELACVEHSSKYNRCGQTTRGNQTMTICNQIKWREFEYRNIRDLANIVTDAGIPSIIYSPKCCEYYIVIVLVLFGRSNVIRT